MLRLPRIALLLVALVAVVPVLAGCSNFDPSEFDPLGLGKKDPLPGKRELLFPNGVPGVTQGIPPQYREGYHAPGIGDLPPGDSDATPAASQTATAVPTKPVQESSLGKPMAVHRTTVKHKAKLRHHRVVKRKRKVKAKATATAAKPSTTPKGTAAPWPSTPKAAAAKPTGTQAPWPSTTPSQSNQAGWPSAQESQSADQKLAPWPSAPPSGTFSKQ